MNNIIQQYRTQRFVFTSTHSAESVLAKMVEVCNRGRLDYTDDLAGEVENGNEFEFAGKTMPTPRGGGGTAVSIRGKVLPTEKGCEVHAEVWPVFIYYLVPVVSVIAAVILMMRALKDNDILTGCMEAAAVIIIPTPCVALYIYSSKQTLLTSFTEAFNLHKA